MKVSPTDHRSKVCPHCKSKKVKPVAVVRLDDNQWTLEVTQVNRTGYLCDNCKRYSKTTVFHYDRAEMKRDIARLAGFLLKGTNNA